MSWAARQGSSSSSLPSHSLESGPLVESLAGEGGDDDECGVEKRCLNTIDKYIQSMHAEGKVVSGHLARVHSLNRGFKGVDATFLRRWYCLKPDQSNVLMGVLGFKDVQGKG
eukprot:2697017-Pyramimonas_sp.AAC.1